MRKYKIQAETTNQVTFALFPLTGGNIKKTHFKPEQIELWPDLTGRLWFLITQIIDNSIVPLTPRRLYRRNGLYPWYLSGIDNIAV